MRPATNALLGAIVGRLDAIQEVLKNFIASVDAAQHRDAEARQRQNEAITEQARLANTTERKRSTEQKKGLCVQWVIAIGTWAAVVAASIYAAIAIGQLMEMHKATVFSERAYINVNGLSITPINDAKGSIAFWNVSPKIANSGNTSTREMWFTAIFGDFQRARADGGPPNPLTENLNSAIRNRGTIGARQETDILIQQPIENRVMEAARNRQISIHIDGAIVYGDFFTTGLHITRYCYVLWANPALTGVSGISYSMCGGRTNCQDAECDAETQKEIKEIATKPN